MKIVFSDNLNAVADKPFAVYRYDETAAQRYGYIDVRTIITENRDQWLDDIHRSFAELSQIMTLRTRWWWTTGASRIDLRPWGQEEVFKPLFFARAICVWLGSNPKIDEIILAGCPNEVKTYLGEIRPGIIFDDQRSDTSVFPFTVKLILNGMIGLLKSVKNALHVAVNHLFYTPDKKTAQRLVLYELIADVTLSQGHQYYYDGIFEKNQGPSVLFGCIDHPSARVRKLRPQLNNIVFFILDHITAGGFMKTLMINVYLIGLIMLLCLRKRAFTFGDYRLRWFWPRYLMEDLARAPYFNAITVYFALKNVLQNSGTEEVVYPYEEKACERSILFACREASVRTTGYIPHPQHKLLLSLRDAHAPLPPKPLQYAVCGEKYIGYLTDWCRKDPAAISVWGSRKSIGQNYKAKALDRNRLKILLTLSHPNELGVFYTWLIKEPRLTLGITYFLRIYKAAGYRRFEERLNLIRKRFDCLHEIDGSLQDNIDQCDLACFSATSAGLLAVNGGILSVHLALDDFFAINPCFDECAPMLSCAGAKALAGRLEHLCALDGRQLEELYASELGFVRTIFHPIDRQAIDYGASTEQRASKQMNVSVKVSA